MGLENVYKCLTELFPEVDHRILRAVALENPKNVHAAVDDVLTEVIPRFYEDGNLPSKDSSVEFASKIEVENKTKMDSSESGTIGGEVSDNISQESGVAHLDAALNQSVSVNNYVASDDCEQSWENTETASLTVPAGIQEDDSEVGLNHVAPGKSNGLVNEDSEPNDHIQTGQLARILNQVTEDVEQDKTLFDGRLNDFHSHVFPDLNTMLVQELYRVKSNGLVNEDDEHNDHKQTRQLARILNQVTADLEQDKTLFDGVDGRLNDFHSHVFCDLNTVLVQELYSLKSNYDSFSLDENSDSQIADPSTENHSESGHQKSNENGTSNLSPKQECSTGEMSVIEDGLMGHTLITQSGQPCSIDLLDEIMEDAKSNKINLFSAMESVLNKMRVLEHKEKYVEKSKEEAANEELEILAKVEEMKQRVAHAKESNDMHAGEVYGEKAILATETRELQSRLLSLSDERDRSLSILDEMHTTLKARIAAVDAVLKATEEEKLAKEEHALNALAEQEALMEKVVQESAILRQEAEENSKLREFLNHRGQLVDMLQGEISVICEDVMLLKEKFDLEVPLSKSLSSSQTSCILASSGSSLKSATCDLAPFCLPLKDIPSHLDAEKGASSNQGKEGSQAASVSSSSLSSNNLEEERERNHFKAFSDDGWEVFDKDAEFSEASYYVDAKE